MNKKNKRGLSGVIASLLLIILVLIAIGAIWLVVNNLISKGVEDIDTGKITVYMKIESASVNSSGVNVIVKREIGAGSPIGISFILVDNAGNSEIIENYAALDENEQKVFVVQPQELALAEISSVSIAPIFGKGTTKESVGAITDDVDVEYTFDLSSALYIFVPSFSSAGDIGVTVADENCDTSLSRPADRPSSTYKALLATSSRDVRTQVLSSGESYKNVDGDYLGSTNSAGWFTGDLANQIYSTQVGIWTGIDASGVHSSKDCLGWTSASGADSGDGGLANNVTLVGAFAHSLSMPCSNAEGRVYCVEQP